MRSHVILAVFRRNFVSYFSQPTGYVFITLFILLSTVAAFWPDSFFTRNLANLDTLNYYFPFLLIFFVPSITMGVWAEERRRGTDELLLTLPARDMELVLGKYLSALGIYTVALFFSLSHVIVLMVLGRPDIGVMFGTYLGYWFLGAALLSVGIVASLISSSMTVAFILGALFCVVPVFLADAGVITPDAFQEWVIAPGITVPFQDLTSGVLSLRAVVYFISLIALMLYVQLVLLSRRHWKRPGEGAHALIRLISLFVAVTSLGILAERLAWRLDLTSERLHSLAGETRDVLDRIDPKRPVYIDAYVSPEVPSSYVRTRETLLTLLREIDALGGGRVLLRVTDTERYTPEARAAEKLGVASEQVREMDEGAGGIGVIYMGIVFRCGTDEVVIPFMHRGLPVEYELTRSIGTVAGRKRKKVGVAATEVKLHGGFDFQRMSSDPEWSILSELKKQYEVVQVALDEEVTENLDALIVAMPSSLSQPQMDNLLAYVKKGGPALLFDDPLPLINPGLGANEPRRPPQQGMMGMPPRPPGDPKGDIVGLLDEIGITWPTRDVAWDTYNPHPSMAYLPEEFVFVGPGGGNARAFNPDDPVTSGLQEMALLCPGRLRQRKDVPLTFTPLLETTLRCGTVPHDQILQRSFFGYGGFNPSRPRFRSTEELILAAHVKGTLPAPKPKEGGKPQEPSKINVIMVADLDLISEQFYAIRRDAPQGLNFDNIIFVLNCVDVLAGDLSYVELRKRRPGHRTLEMIEKYKVAHIENQISEIKAAENAAKAELDEAQKRLNEAVDRIRKREDLDARSKDIQTSYLEDVENRKLERRRREIEDEKQKRIDQSKQDTKMAARSIQKQIKVWAGILPPLPVLAIGVVIFFQRRTRERRTA